MDTTTTTAPTTTFDIEIGDIFYSSWGYSMTIVSWYQVIATTPKMITVQEIQGKITQGNGMQGESVPLPDYFTPKHSWESEPRTYRRLFVHGRIKINDSEYARPWDGLPKFHDHWD